MSSQGKRNERNDPTKPHPSVIVDEFIYKDPHYEQFDTRPLPHESTEVVTTVFEEVGVGRVVPRTANIVVDEILDGTLQMHSSNPKEAYAHVARPPQPKKSGKTVTRHEVEHVGDSTEEHFQKHTTTIHRTQHIEDEIFKSGQGQAEHHEEQGERGAATKHNPNSLVDEFFGGGPKGKTINRTTVTTSRRDEQLSRSINKSSKDLRAQEASHQSPSKGSERSIEASNSMRLASIFLRLTLKKKEMAISGLTFSRLILQTYKGKQLKHRISSFASIFSHIRNRKVAQGFSSVLSAGYRRVPKLAIEPSSPRQSKEHTSSTTRLARTSRNRLEVREKSSASLGVDDDKEEEKKIMALSEEAKTAIMNFQRFDRYIFPFESEKHLKVPIENELRRLEKIKSANKSMWNTYYDNELIITCLYNHMKNLYELNRDLEQIDLLKVQNEKLERRIIETNIQKKKELDEARGKNPVPAGQQNTLLKEYQRSTEFLTTTLQETNEKARKLLENQLKKGAASPHKELLEVTLEMINELVQLQETNNESATIHGLLAKLIEEQADSTRTIQSLERHRKTFEKGASEAKTNELRNMNNSLVSICSYLITLHSKLRTLKGEGSAQFQDPNLLSRLKGDLENERTRIRDLEAKIQQLNKEKRALEDMKDITVLTTWETELTQIIEKSENKEAYQSDIGKQRKLLTMRKDNRYNSIITLNLNLLESMLKKDREIEKLERQVQERPTAPGPTKQLEQKYNKERIRAEAAEAELARIAEELESLKRKEKQREREKDPLQAELLELFKICALMEQALAAREAEAASNAAINSSTTDLQKARKNLEKSKKESSNVQPIVSMLETLTRLLLEIDAKERNRLKEEEKFELQRTKELNGIDTFTKIFMRLVEAEGIKVDDGLISRLRKNLDITRGKLDKGAQDSPVSDLYDMYRNVVEMQARLIELMEMTLKNAKEESIISLQQRLPIQSVDRKQKDQEESQNKRIQQLEKQLQIEKERFTTRNQQMNRLKEAEDSLNKRLQQLEKQLEVEKNRLAIREQELTGREEELKRLRTDLQAKEQELRTSRGELTTRDQELKRLTAESNKKGDLDTQVRNLKESNQKYVETERSLQRRIAELERSEADSKRQAGQTQKQIVQLQKQYNDQAREASESQRLNVEANRQLADLHKQIGQNSKLSTDGRNKVKELSDQISELNRQVKQTNTQNSSLTEQNRNLDERNKQMTSELKDLNGQVRDLNGQVRELTNQIKELNGRELESQRIITDLRSRQEQSTSKASQQNQQVLDRLQKDKERLQASVADLNRQLGEITGKESSSSQQVRNLTRDLETANRNLKQKTDELVNEQRQIQRLRDELNRTYTGKSDDLQRLQNENRVQNMELTRLREELSKANSELARLRDELTRANSELQRIKNDRSQSSSDALELRNTILVLERKIVGLEGTSNQIKFLEEANRSLKDENDMLREELLSRGKSTQSTVSDASRLTNDYNRLQQDYNRLQQEHSKLRSDNDRALSQKQAEVANAEAEARRLSNIINSNEQQFNALMKDNEVLLHDNQAFFNDINVFKQREADQTRVIQQLEAKLGGKATDAASATALRSEFNAKESRYLEEIRGLKQDKSNLERDLQSRQSSQEMLKSMSERESKLRTEKADLERELMNRTNEISELKVRASQISSQSQTSSAEVSKLRSEFATKEESFRRTIRQLETREADLRKLVDSNSAMYNQNEARFNAELNNLRVQLASRGTSASELQRLKITHVERTVLDQKERELREATNTITRLQSEKRSVEDLLSKKTRDYDVIILELNNQKRTEHNHHSRTDELERANERIQRQLVEVEARFEQQSRQLERVRTSNVPHAEMASPNSRYMMVMEEKKVIEIEVNRLKGVIDKEGAFRRELEEKFAAILQEKTRFLEKINALQRAVHAKELDLMKNYEAREENLHDLINENKKLQRELKIINEKLSAEHRISLKSLEDNLAKMEMDLSKLRRENATLKDEIEDLEDQLEGRSRNITPNRHASRIRQPQPGEEDYDERYLLKVDGDRMREEIYYLECSNEKLKQKIRNLEDQSVHSVRSGGDSYRRISHSRVLGDDRVSNLNDKLTEKVKYLERERHTLYQRLKILSVFSRVEQDNHAFVHNLNRVLDNILQFLNDSQEFSESFITYGNFISQISESVTADNYERYFQNVEDFLKDLFLRTFESKNEILAKQAGQLIHFREQMSELVNEQIDYIEEEERVAPKSSYSRHNDFDRPQYAEPAGMASFIALQHLFRLYVRAKSPEVLEEIAQLLNINELGLEGLVV